MLRLSSSDQAEHTALSARFLLLARRLTPTAHRVIRSRPSGEEQGLPRVALVMAVSGAYGRYIPALLRSARRLLLPAEAVLSFVIFGDKPAFESASTAVLRRRSMKNARSALKSSHTGRRTSHLSSKNIEFSLRTVTGLLGPRVTWVLRPARLGWPLAAMMRSRHYVDAWHLVGQADFAFSIDVDCLFVAPISAREILAPMVAVTHGDNAFFDGTELVSPNRTMARTSFPQATFWQQAEIIDRNSKKTVVSGHQTTRHRPIGVEDMNLQPGPAPYERRPESAAMVPTGAGQRYYYAGLYGGNIDEFLALSLAVARRTEADLARGLIAQVHDESHLNRYWAIDRHPDRVLSSAYMYPEAAIMMDPPLCFPNIHCPRDEMHPWLWRSSVSPCETTGCDEDANPESRRPLLVPRILNLAKDKEHLVVHDGGRVKGSSIPERRDGGKRLGIPSTAGSGIDPPGVRRIVAWSADLHVGPIGDLKEILRAHGILVDDRSMSAHCGAAGTCGGPQLFEGILGPHNALKLEPEPSVQRVDAGGVVGQRDPRPHEGPGNQHVVQLVEAFTRAFNARKGAPTSESQGFMSTAEVDSAGWLGLARSDLVLCIHPASLCEVYAGLGKPLLIYLTTRPDLGRSHSAGALARWSTTLSELARRPNVAVAANNVYDAAYADYFAGLSHVPVIPSLCRAAGPRWSGRSERPVLLDVCDDRRCPPFRQAAVRRLVDDLRATAARWNSAIGQPARRKSRSSATPAHRRRVHLADLRELYPRGPDDAGTGGYRPEDLAQHPAIVWLPYQVEFFNLWCSCRTNAVLHPPVSGCI
mmetsp:Transcript_81970/g.220122  ORF Transcript_81970/g.220122 Transcript_81970/m.220122 type:complete len:814 (+) Transcript_81970:462-2903(+)